MLFRRWPLLTKISIKKIFNPDFFYLVQIQIIYIGLNSSALQKVAIADQDIQGEHFFIQMIFQFSLKSFLLRSTAIPFRRWPLLLTKITRKEKAMMIFQMIFEHYCGIVQIDIINTFPKHVLCTLNFEADTVGIFMIQRSCRELMKYSVSLVPFIPPVITTATTKGDGRCSTQHRQMKTFGKITFYWNILLIFFLIN